MKLIRTNKSVAAQPCCFEETTARSHFSLREKSYCSEGTIGNNRALVNPPKGASCYDRHLGSALGMLQEAPFGGWSALRGQCCQLIGDLLFYALVPSRGSPRAPMSIKQRRFAPQGGIFFRRSNYEVLFRTR